MPRPLFTPREITLPALVLAAVLLGQTGQLHLRGRNMPALVAAVLDKTGTLTAGRPEVEEVRPGPLPEHKVETVRALREEGRRVLVAGDGVNDGPALAAADLAVVMGRSGTDVALGLSGATLVDDRVERLPLLLDHGRRAVGVIRGNVRAAMTINAAGVVLGALGLIGPVAGAVIHNASSLAVVLNSARLAWGGRRVPEGD